MRTRHLRSPLPLLPPICLLLAATAGAQEYVMDPDWPKPLPDDIEWGQVPNVTIDRDGYIYAFHRSDPPVLKFDAEGNLVDIEDPDATRRTFLYDARHLLLERADRRGGPPPPADPTDPARRLDPLRLVDWALDRTPLVRFRQDHLAGHDGLIAMDRPGAPA